MRMLLRAVTSSIGILVIVGIIISLGIWFVGPLVAIGEAKPFGTLIGRLIGLAVFWLITLIVILIMVVVDNRRESRIVNEVAAAPDPTTADRDGDVKAELGEMRSKMRMALRSLRRSKSNGKRLYELPWYIIIGPPAAGKTTAIINSKLKFPLETDIGKSAVHGEGGTRNCDWWFTDQAVLIDTAGRYTTQTEDPDFDKGAWDGFLGMLKRQRVRQPINGAIVAVSLSDLATMDSAQRHVHAQAIRRQLLELRTKLSVRVPVYVLFTKADLIVGFTEFFDDLRRGDLGQVWGATLPLPVRGVPVQFGDQFTAEFDALLERLNSRLLQRMQDERDPQKRALLSAFPAQFASLKTVAEEFMTEIFHDNGLEKSQLLRGFYFTSGTQEGTPTDRLMSGMARSFGLGRQVIGAAQGKGTSYFLSDFFGSVVFPEAGLVSADDHLERRFRWTRVLAFTAAVLVALGLSFVWGRSYLGNMALAEETQMRAQAYALCINGVGQNASSSGAGADDGMAKAMALAVETGCAPEGLPDSPIADSDALLVLPSLIIAETFPGQDHSAPTPDGLGWGLYQGRSIGGHASVTYKEALNKTFLPRILLHMEEELAANINNPDVLYDGLKAYLMLGKLGPMNRDFVLGWLEKSWQSRYPGTAAEPAVEALMHYVRQMLAPPLDLDTIELNDDLVQMVQGILNEQVPAERVYRSILTSDAAKALTPFRLTAVGGPKITSVMTRPSGAKMAAGIPGIYTRQGFYDVFLSQAVEVAQVINAESWVLGAPQDAEPDKEALILLSRDVLDLYFTDYVVAYNLLLSDVDLVPIGNLAQAAEVTQILSSPTSPLVNILTAVHYETRLTQPPPQPQETSTAEQTGSGLLNAARRVAGREILYSLGTNGRIFLEEVQGTRPLGADGKPPLPGLYVETEFDWLHSLVRSVDNQPSELDDLIGLLRDVFDDLNKINISGQGAVAADSPALLNFRTAATRTEGPLSRWAAQIAISAGDITNQSTRAAISAKWQSDVLSVCSRVTGNAYPFKRSARAEASMQDFTRLFGPGGLIDSFFEENLAQHVTTTSNPWRFQPGRGTALGISQNVLVQFQHAATIRDAFFSTGTTPQLTFQVTPEALDSKARTIIWDIDGQRIEFSQGDRPQPKPVTWPGAVAVSQITLERPKRNSENELLQTGPWALFRMLDAAAVRSGQSPNRIRAFFTIGGRNAIFELQTSTPNPFTLRSLSQFNCPQSF